MRHFCGSGMRDLPCRIETPAFSNPEMSLGSGFDTAEICRIIEVSVTNFSVLLHRARARLRECLEAKGWSKP
jgi:hypothetical protein